MSRLFFPDFNAEFLPVYYLKRKETTKLPNDDVRDDVAATLKQFELKDIKKYSKKDIHLIEKSIPRSV